MKKVLSVVLALALVMMVLVACSNDKNKESNSPDPIVSQPGVSSTDSGGDKGYSIALLYSEETGDFWGIVANGGRAALAELKSQGVEGYLQAPATSGDATLQADQIDAALLANVDGIVLSPSNADSIGTHVTDNFNDDNGVPIVVIDRSLNTTSKWKVAEVAADTYAMGQDIGKLAFDAMGGEGKFVPIGIDTSNQNWLNRTVGATDWLAENAPNMENAIPNEGGEYGAFFTNQNADGAVIPYVQDVCSNNKGEDLVFLTPTEASTNNVTSAIREIESQRGDAKTFICGFDFSELGYDLLTESNPLLYGVTGQNPYKMGYDSTFILVDILDGKEVDSFIPVAYTIVTVDNLDSDEVKEYIESMGLSL